MSFACEPAWTESRKIVPSIYISPNFGRSLERRPYRISIYLLLGDTSQPRYGCSGRATPPSPCRGAASTSRSQSHRTNTRTNRVFAAGRPWPGRLQSLTVRQPARCYGDKSHLPHLIGSLLVARGPCAAPVHPLVHGCPRERYITLHRRPLRYTSDVRPSSVIGEKLFLLSSSTQILANKCTCSMEVLCQKQNFLFYKSNSLSI